MLMAVYIYHILLPFTLYQAVQDTGEKLMAESNIMPEEIQTRLQNLASNWDELKQQASNRGRKLEDSLAYQQFAASVEEEEAWITEKQHLLAGEDYGDSLAAVQVGMEVTSQLWSTARLKIK